MLQESIAAFRAELSEFGRDGARARAAATVAAAVATATLAAFILRLDSSWWAAIAAFRCTQASAADSVSKGALRIVGTLIGAAVAYGAAPFLVYDRPAGCLFLFAAAAASVIGGAVSRHSYAWVLGGITAIMVAMSAIIEPLSTLDVAVYRAAETIVGAVAAMLAAWLFGGSQTAAAADPPGFKDLLGAEWPLVLHGLRAGTAVALMPLVWALFDPPSVTQMAVTAAAVMVTPIKPGEEADRNAVLERGAHRLLGCVIGACCGLACLALSIASLVPWLVMLFIGVWAGAHLQASRRGVSYVGTQVTMAYIMTLIQGFGPPASIMPGVERFAGMVSGLTVLLFVSFLIWPGPVAALPVSSTPASPEPAPAGGAERSAEA